MIDDKKVIGVVGGVGPFAGVDLVRKVLGQTAAEKDQDHLPVILMSLPHLIADRTEFLTGREGVNPGGAIGEIILNLERLGADVIGIPCNTAHAPRIFDSITAVLSEHGSRAKVLHLIGEVVAFLRRSHPDRRNVGILATEGTYRANVYGDRLESAGFGVVLPDGRTKRMLHDAIYDRRYGIKSVPNEAGGKAREAILEAVSRLRQSGAESVLLGCTELPLAVPEGVFEGTPLIDPNLVLARALIAAASPERLRK